MKVANGLLTLDLREEGDGTLLHNVGAELTPWLCGPMQAAAERKYGEEWVYYDVTKGVEIFDEKGERWTEMEEVMKKVDAALAEMDRIFHERYNCWDDRPKKES